MHFPETKLILDGSCITTRHHINHVVWVPTAQLRITIAVLHKQFSELKLIKYLHFSTFEQYWDKFVGILVDQLCFIWGKARSIKFCLTSFLSPPLPYLQVSFCQTWSTCLVYFKKNLISLCGSKEVWLKFCLFDRTLDLFVYLANIRMCISPDRPINEFDAILCMMTYLMGRWTSFTWFNSCYTRFYLCVQFSFFCYFSCTWHLI